MHLKIARVTRGSKVYQYAQLVESYRRTDGVSTQRMVANLGQRDDLEIANLRKALAASRDGKSVVVTAPEHDARHIEVLDNLAWLDVAVVIEILRRLGVRSILDEELAREGAEVADADVALALVAQRCVDPGSKLAAVEWFGRTALPELLDLPASRFNNTRIHRVLCGLESVEDKLQGRLASAIHARKGPFSVLYLDLTDTWFVGRGPPLATQGKTKEGLYRRKVGIALLCDDVGLPLRWSVVEGRRHDSGPMKDIARSLQSVPWAHGVPMVMDRAMGATAHIVELLDADRPFITALTRNEFDAYTDRIPASPLTELPWNTPGAVTGAASAVAGAGMTRVSDDLYVLELGVVTRKQPATPANRPPTPGQDKCRERLAAAVQMQAALDSGQADSLATAGAVHGFAVALACKAMRLLRLAPDIQRSIAAGEAAILSLDELRAMTHIEDFEAQRQSWHAALDSGRARPDGRRTRKAGKVTAAPASPPEPTSPPQLRAVVAFNPEQWVRQMQTFDEIRGELRAWADRKNQTAREPTSTLTATKLTQAAHARLARNNLTDAYVVEVTSQRVDGRDVPQIRLEPDPAAFSARRRFFGFQVIVANPDECRGAAQLVAQYRAKDKVEKDFQTIKSVLSLRPVRHRTDVKLRAHVTLCMLALLVERTLDQALHGRATGTAALDTLADVHLNRIRTAASALPVYAITRPKAEHLALLRALDLSYLVDDARMTSTLQPR